MVQTEHTLITASVQLTGKHAVDGVLVQSDQTLITTSCTALKGRAGTLWTALSAYHVFSEVVVVDEESSGLIVDGGHGTVEVHASNWSHLAHIHLHTGNYQLRRMQLRRMQSRVSGRHDWTCSFITVNTNI